jgi:hypothetical protein
MNAEKDKVSILMQFLIFSMVIPNIFYDCKVVLKQLQYSRNANETLGLE